MHGNIGAVDFRLSVYSRNTGSTSMCSDWYAKKEGVVGSGNIYKKAANGKAKCGLPCAAAQVGIDSGQYMH